jgi:class 3 adenylate cyclase
MFEAWEGLAGDFGVQKIKTIGDAFMAASGLLEPAPGAVASCVRLGLKMIEHTQGLRDDDGDSLGFNLRVGVHWGTVVCGVLGRRQFLYDLWGDAVNIASRLESQGEPGCVNLSPAAWGHVAGIVRGERREVRQLRGKPEPIEVVQLNPRRIEWLA